MNILILFVPLGRAPDCQQATARHSFHAPPSNGGMESCMREGMLSAARSRLVDPGSYVKVICRYADGPGHKAEIQ